MNKSYGEIPAVKRLSFSVAASTCFGLLGPNGAGKTTMMKMIYAKCLRDSPAESTIKVFGHDPATNELAIKALSGVVPQEDNLDEELSVLQNLRVYARLYGMPRAVADGRIDELLAFMELGEKRQVKIKELSGGMKRRLIIARALLNAPRLLILDEPTTGLDPQVRHLIWDKLRKLKAEGMTILLTTHYMEEAFQICDRILIMHKGEKLMEGEPRALLSGRLEPYVLEARGDERGGGWHGGGSGAHGGGSGASGGRGGIDAAEVAGPGLRVEAGPDVLRVFSPDHEALRALAARLGVGEFAVRPTNLEDLFLQATGTALDE